MKSHSRSTARNGARTTEPISFGPFELYVSERRLEKSGSAIPLAGHAIDILILLVEQAGKVVAKTELLAKVWPDGKSDERNLRVHVAAIRKTLDDGASNARYVTTVSGQGYCFVARISSPGGSTGAPDALRFGPTHHLPAPLTKIVGRAQPIQELSDRIHRERFITIVGPGGIGKTTVAISTAHGLVEQFPGAIHFFDFGAIHEPALVSTVVASTFGLLVKSIDPLDALVAYLRDKRILLIFDCCEHVIETSAALAERLHGEAPHLHILTTSRERLRVEGEHVYRMPPLEHPFDERGLTALQALAFPAVQLFLEYAAIHHGRFELNDSNAPLVGEICRKLDGIPLAIELAAKRTSTHGINETAALLNDRFALLWKGRRTALPRHRTLRATIDWSYNLLSQVERIALSRLSVFSGPFTLDSARSIVAADDITRAQAVSAVESLVAKSLLLSILPADAPARFRLQDTTRQYASEKLLEYGDAEAATGRHIHYFSDLLGLTIDGTSFDHRKALAYSPHLDNLRKALTSSFSRTDDAASIELAARAAPLFLELSLYGECRQWCERALALLGGRNSGTQRDLDLQEAFAISFLWTHHIPHEIQATIEHGFKLSEALGDDRRQVRYLVGLNISFTGAGDFCSALDVALRCVAVAARAGLTAEAVIAEWVLGAAYHFAGNQISALYHCERGFTLEQDVESVPENVFGFDHRARARVVLARSLWLRGLSDQAYQMADRIVRDPADNSPPISRSIAALYTIPVFLWMGRFADAAEPIERAIANSLRSPFPRDHAIGLALKGEVLVADGNVRAGVDTLRSSLERLQDLRLHNIAPAISCALCEGLIMLGQPEEAHVIIEDAYARVNESKNIFWLPNLLRVRAKVLLALPIPNFQAAETALLDSITRAREQSALGWELKSVIILAQTWTVRRRRGEARLLLENILHQFTEGFWTRDLVAATRMLDELRLET